MASLNKVMLIGNVGADPELRKTSGGNSVCELRIATNERWTGQDGQAQERTEWHRVIVWGRQADNVAKYLTKGRSAYVEGRIQTREWTDKEGNKRYTTEIVANQVLFLSQGAGGGGGGGRRSDGPPPFSDADAPSGDFGGGGGGGGFGDDDIPF